MTEPSAPPSRSRAITVICWTAILGVVAFLALGRAVKAHAGGGTPAAAPSESPPGFDLLAAGRVAVSMAQNATMAEPMRVQLRTSLDDLAHRPIDRLAEATVVRELSGTAAALKLLAPQATGPRAGPDAAALVAVYTADSPAVLSDVQRADLARDLGFFGRLAATQGGPADAPARLAVLAEAHRTSVILTTAVALAALAFVTGLVGFIILCVLFGTGALRFAYRPPPTQQPVWLETFAIWMAAFVLFSLATSRLPWQLPMAASEGLVAALSAAIAIGWPMWRTKASFADVRRTLGLHTGAGWLFETGCGVVGYVAGLPVLGAGALLTYALIKLAHAHPSHPISQEFGEHMSRGHVLALFVTAAVLAPILEETLFRGALYAHLRRRHWAWLSAGIVAFIFAAIHPQGWTTIPVLGSIALILAFLREWRGSLIAPMTAHAINNGVLVAVVVVAIG